MPANEFEKKLQQRMGELKLTPSDEVWTEVEHRIRKEKKKRRAFIWLPLLFLMLGGGLATILLTNKKNNDIVQSEEQLKKPQLNSPAQKQSADEVTPTQNNSEKINAEKNKLSGVTIKEYSNKDVKESSIFKKEFSQRNNEQVKKEGIGETKSEKEISDNSIIADKSAKHNDETIIKDKINLNQPVNHQKDTMTSKEIVAKKTEDIQKIQSSAQSTKDSADVIAKQQAPIHISKRKSKWQLEIFLQKGESHTAKGLQFTGRSFAADMAYASANSNPGSAAPVYGPSAKRPSGSFAFGVMAKKSLSSKFDLNLSLGYSFLSTKMNVGKRVDSSVSINNSSSLGRFDNYYRASNNNLSYTNRYHFLSLSAEVSWKIINDKKVNIYWNNGISYNRLLSSNALNYDRSLQGYYKDFGSLTHNHVFLSSGLSIPVFKRFDLNPFAEYSVTPLLRHSGAARTHFSNYGVRIHFLLKK